jgi:hypothetical protein
LKGGVVDTKLKADIAESSVTTELLSRGYNVLKPIGDRLPYDLAIDCEGKLIRLQIKTAWFNRLKNMYIVDNRRTRTNRRKMVRKRYTDKDFDFAILYLHDKNVFYVMPVDVFNGYASSIALIENMKRQRLPKSTNYRGRWDLLNEPEEKRPSIS